MRGGGFEYEIEHISSLIIDEKYQSDIIRTETSRQIILMMETSLMDSGITTVRGKY